jgi:hypothetical protein
VGRCLNGVVEEADGRGEPGRRDGGAGSGAAARGRRGGALEVEGAPDMWVPHVREIKRGRERRGERRRRSGPRGPKRGWAAGVGLGC